MNAHNLSNSRKGLDTCWQFADSLSPKFKWGLLASAFDIDTVETSYFYYVRSNDTLLMTIAKGWRQLGSIEANRTFSFLIANPEVLSDNPDLYTRLFLRGKFTKVPVNSDQFDHLYPIYIANNWDVPIDSLEYLCIFTPVFAEYSGKNAVPEFKDVKVVLNLDYQKFDLDGNYTDN